MQHRNDYHTSTMVLDAKYMCHTSLTMVSIMAGNREDLMQ